MHFMQREAAGMWHIANYSAIDVIILLLLLSMYRVLYVQCAL